MKSEVKYTLEDCTIPEMQAFVDACLRRKSPKTGRLIKINTYKCRREDIVGLLKYNHMEKKCCLWLNAVYYDIPGYSNLDNLKKLMA